jgi:hypothetical protein
MSPSRFCTLEPGAVIFYERFEGFEATKDRYFIVITRGAPVVECFTTTTQDHAQRIPRLSSEFFGISYGESCLPKRCFVDFRNVYEFGDTEISSRLRSRSIRHLGDLSAAVVARMCDRLNACRSLSAIQKERFLRSLLV